MAIESMKIVNKEFRQKIKEKIGYDDTHIDILYRDLENQMKLNNQFLYKHNRANRKIFKKKF